MLVTPPDSYRTWTVSDGHAGNLRQASALARALGIGGEPEDRVLQPSALARLLAPRTWPLLSAPFGPSFRADCASPPDIAIGCGRQAALATRLLRERGSKAVQILDPRIDPRHWDLVIAPEHDSVRGPNVLNLLGSLNPVDDAWLADARHRFAAFETLPAPRTTVLIGGSSRHARVDGDALARLFALLDPALASEGGSVLLSASRRTDPALHGALRDFSARRPGMAWLGDADGENPYPGLLAWADRIVCTADSVNMISEASATRAPVFVFDPQRVAGRPRQFLDALLTRGRIRPADAVLAPFPVEPLRETARIAALVKARLSSQASAAGAT